MKQMKVWASIPEKYYQFIDHVIGFENFDQWICEKIDMDRRNGYDKGNGKQY